MEELTIAKYLCEVCNDQIGLRLKINKCLAKDFFTLGKSSEALKCLEACFRLDTNFCMVCIFGLFLSFNSFLIGYTLQGDVTLYSTRPTAFKTRSKIENTSECKTYSLMDHLSFSFLYAFTCKKTSFKSHVHAEYMTITEESTKPKSLQFSY